VFVHAYQARILRVALEKLFQCVAVGILPAGARFIFFLGCREGDIFSTGEYLGDAGG
jgi:hypothetical protein